VSKQTTLAITWNANDSGRLWTREWYVTEGASYGARLIAPGVYAPDSIFESEEAFWIEFEKDRQQFFGRRLDESEQH